MDAAKERNLPIRVGVNSGSLEKELVEKYHGVTAEGIVESALDKVKMIEDMDYTNLVISIKSSDVLMCARAHEDVYKRQDLELSSCKEKANPYLQEQMFEEYTRKNGLPNPPALQTTA